MEYGRVVKILRCGRVEGEITLGRDALGSWDYQTRLFRSYRNRKKGKTLRAHSFVLADLADLFDVALRAHNWITEQLEKQQTVTIDDEKEAA